MSVTPSRPGPDTVAITRSLQGFTELRHFELTCDSNSLLYDLKLTLANQNEQTVTLVCHDVQNLELNPGGDGFHQLLLLRVEDVRDNGLDRIHFTVDELENETLFLHSAQVELLKN